MNNSSDTMRQRIIFHCNHPIIIIVCWNFLSLSSLLSLSVPFPSCLVSVLRYRTTKSKAFISLTTITSNWNIRKLNHCLRDWFIIHLFNCMEILLCRLFYLFQFEMIRFLFTYQQIPTLDKWKVFLWHISKSNLNVLGHSHFPIKYCICVAFDWYFDPSSPITQLKNAERQTMFYSILVIGNVKQQSILNGRFLCTLLSSKYTVYISSLSLAKWDSIFAMSQFCLLFSKSNSTNSQYILCLCKLIAAQYKKITKNRVN